MFRRILPRMAQRTPKLTRTNATYQPPSQGPAKSNPHRDFYKGFGRPVAYNFLIALATFQVLHWSWLKLESIETKHNTDAEVNTLEEELKGLTLSKETSK
jgi:hypothetical protein